MAVETFTRPYDYDPSVTKEVVVAEPHTIPASAPYSVYLRHIPRQQTPSTVAISGASTTWTEVATPPSASGEYRVRYDEALGRIEFHSSDAGKSITVNYNACGTVIWGEDRGDGRPNVEEMQEVLERVQDASGIDYASAVSGFSHADIKAALDALAGVRIVEMGENENGSYVRWENGLQVCWGLLTNLAVDTAYGSGGLYFNTTPGTWTFPASFAAVPTIAGAGMRVSGTGFGVLGPMDVGLLTTGVTVRIVTNVNASTHNVHMIAIGRWK